jgi:hypothetical protein
MKSIWKKIAIAVVTILIFLMNCSAEEMSGAQAQKIYLDSQLKQNYSSHLELHQPSIYYLQITLSILYLPFVLNQVPSPSIQTQVIVFYPTGSSEPSRYGDCWTSSLDILRPDAWRCVDTNHYVFDPCISPLNETRYVVCDASPLGNSDGFRLYLTQPLPDPTPIDPNLEKSFAWAFKLFDGTTCSLIQASTWPTCLPRYSCSDGLEVKDYPNPSVLWTAERGQFDVNSCSLTQPVLSNIQTVWK